MAKPGKQLSAPPPNARNRAWCARHHEPRHPDELSALLRSKVLWYRRTRAAFIAELGSKCVDCGATEELEFDELVARPAAQAQPNRTSRWQRLRNYIKLWRAGRALGQEWIALRCRVCNAKRGAPSSQTLPHGSHDDPF